MKSFIWFTTVLLLCLELASAAHIPHIHALRRHYKRSPTSKPARVLRKRAGTSCKPLLAANTTIISSNPNYNKNNSTSSNPTPSNSTPSSPTPSNPTPSNSTPSKSTPSNSTPSNSTSSNSTSGNSNSSNSTSSNQTNNSTTSRSSGFPSLGFEMPTSVPSSLDGWWSDYTAEIGFLGFSYSVAGCQSSDTLQSEFQDIRTRFNGRYVRLYGACDQDGFYDNVVDAAWNAGLGVHALIWFGFDGDDMWMTRRDSLFSTLHSNPKAKFVTRAVQFGSEPLFDHVLSADDLATQVKSAQQNLSDLSIPVTVSDMAYGYQSNDGAQSVLDAIDFVDLHMLPYFSTTATTASDSWGFIQNDLDWITTRVNGKKIILSENGWPAMESGSTVSSSPTAVADLQQSQDYFDLLDSNCQQLKSNPGGGVAWFAHLYSVDQDPSYGVLSNGEPQFSFSPKTSC